MNRLARCFGVATKSHPLFQTLRKAGNQNTLAGTRKTTPGFRLVEKYGMLVGGCDARCNDLSAMTMLKDNHTWACRGPIPTAVALAAAKAVGGFAVKIEVDCQSEDEANTAIGTGADFVMLDNFTRPGVKAASKRLKDRWGRGPGGKALMEVSGNFTEENVLDYMCDDIDVIDVISSPGIHQVVKYVEFFLKVVPKDKRQADGTGDHILSQ